MTVQEEQEGHGLEVLPNITNIDLIHGIDIIGVRQGTHIEINDTTGVNQEIHIINEIKNEVTEVLVITEINQIMILRINSPIILDQIRDQI
jgi:hypothetical protein